MTDDIVDRLRDYACRGAVYATNDMASEAADEIERLRAEVERLRAAGDVLAEATAWWNRGNDLGDAARVWQEARRG